MYGTIPIFYPAPYSGGSTPPPFEGDWREFNGSSDFPIAALGLIYDQWVLSYGMTPVAIKIDETRTLLISEGYYDYNTSINYPFICRVGTHSDSEITWGTPVEIDADIPTNGTVLSCRGDRVTDGKICINYGGNDFEGNPFNKALIILIDGSNNITFGDAVDTGNDHGVLDCTTYDETHVITMYQSANNTVVSVRSLTINVDNTLLPNTAQPVITAPNVFGRIIVLTPDFLMVTGNQRAHIVPVSGGGTTFSLPIANVNLSPDGTGSGIGSISAAKLNDMQVMCVFDDLVPVSNLGRLGAVTVTWDGENLTKGNTVFWFMQRDIFSNETAYSLDAFATKNEGNQVIATYSQFLVNTQYQNIFAICLTPNDDNILAGNPVPINANNNDFLTQNFFLTRGCILNANTIIMPNMTYDGVNYGASVLNRVPLYEVPTQIAAWEADHGIDANLTASLANVVGTMGTNQFAAPAIDLRGILLPGTKIYVTEISIPAVFYVEFVSYSLVTMISTITVTTTLPATYGSSTLQIDDLSHWFDKTDTYQFNNEGGSINPSTGIVNGQPTVIFYSNNAHAALLVEDLPLPLTIDATLFIVGTVTNSGLSPSASLNASSAANLTDLIDVKNTLVSIYPDKTLGNFDLMDELSLITVTRTKNNTSVYINGELSANTTQDIFAIGSPISLKLGNNFAADNYLVGYVSAISLWWGALEDDDLAAQNEYYLNKYNIS